MSLTVAGSSYSPGEGSNEISFGCTTGDVPITVSYLDANGTHQFVSKDPMCRNYSQ